MTGARIEPASWLLAALFFVFWAAQTARGPVSWAELTRLAAVESMVERGTQSIDESPLTPLTKDKVMVGGRYYCDKPPLFQVVSAVPYAALHYGFGMRLRPKLCVGWRQCGYRWLTLLTVGLPSALTLAFFLRASARHAGTGAATVVTLLLGLGTMVWPYSLVFNNHVPAAASLFACFLLCIGSGGATPTRGALAGAGLAGGLAIGFDLLAVFPVAALAAVVWHRHRGPAIAAFALGCAGPLAVTAASSFLMTGSPLPPYFAPGGYAYPGSPFADTVGALQAPASVPAYAFVSMVGGRGLLAHAPWLLWALVGLARVALDRKHPLWLESVAVAAGTTAFVVYVLTRTNMHGGTAYGQRYYLSLVPLVAFYASFALPRRRSWGAALLAAATALSVLSARYGAGNPWRPTPPVLYLETRAEFPPLRICSVLAGPREPCRPR